MFRLGHIEEEIRSGYEILRKYHKTVTIFGSARTAPDNSYYLAAKEAAERLAHDGYAIVSGGGHGIMGAANEGANTAVQKGVNSNSVAAVIKYMPLVPQIWYTAALGKTYSSYYPAAMGIGSCDL